MSVLTSFMGKKGMYFGGMGMVPNAVFGMGDVGGIVIGSTVAVIQESIRKVAAWATHGGMK